MAYGSMSRRHFEALAATLYRARHAAQHVAGGCNAPAFEIITGIEDDIMYLCEHENPSFDRERFTARSGRDTLT